MKAENAMNGLLTVEDAGDILRLWKRTVYGWARFDFIPHARMGAVVRSDEAAVKMWFKSRQSPGRGTLKS